MTARRNNLTARRTQHTWGVAAITANPGLDEERVKAAAGERSGALTRDERAPYSTVAATPHHQQRDRSREEHDLSRGEPDAGPENMTTHANNMTTRPDYLTARRKNMTTHAENLTARRENLTARGGVHAAANPGGTGGRTA
jgi:hypothetical protein